MTLTFKKLATAVEAVNEGAAVYKCAVGGTWLHTSCSVRGQRRLPTWEELSMVKQAVHEDRLVVQVLPPRSAYVNIAEVLHLWERIDALTLPDDVWRR